MGKIYSDESLHDSSSNRKKPNKNLVLNSYGINISKLAADGKIDPVIGRDDEILRVTQILSRRRKNNPILVGEPGVGKSSIVEGLALKIIEGNVPLSLQGKTIYTLELGTLVAGSKYRGEFEERIKSIVDELIENPNIIIFIDEIHTLVGAGSTSGSLDAANIIKPALARGDIRCIGATTFDEFRETIEGDGALDRRFQKVIVNEPSLDETKHILLNIRNKYESYHNVTYSDEVISLIIKIANDYIPGRYFPDKAIDILDEVGSYKKIVESKIPKKIQILEEKLIKKEKEKHDAIAVQDYELAALRRDYCLVIKSQIEKEVLSWKKQTEEFKHTITDDDVLKVVAKSTGLPLEKINDNENQALININNKLNTDVIGQKEAIDKIAITIKRNRIGIRKRNRTIGNFIFLGATGVGKTYLAKKIAEHLFNSEDSLIRIDMSEYMEPHAVSKLIGAPPGYIGYNEGGLLTEQVKRKPYSVVLFDEIEKAHPAIFNVLLQLLDDGYVTDSIGRKIDFRNCLVILTSNAGARTVHEFGQGIGFTTSNMIKKEEHEREVLTKALNHNFSPEFLNRIDDIIIFNKLSKNDITEILNNECSILRHNLYDINQYHFRITKAAKQLVIDNGYDPKFGARPLRRTLEKMIENPISEMILSGKIKKGNIIRVGVAKECIKIDVLEKN